MNNSLDLKKSEKGKGKGKKEKEKIIQRKWIKTRRKIWLKMKIEE